MHNQDLYQKTILFAGNAHIGQKIPGTDVSYIVHISNVCMEVIAALTKDASGVDENVCMQGALLHDTIEDTAVTFEELAKIFGEDVAKVVQALTKNEALPKSERMLDSLNRIIVAGKEAAIIKIADRIVNLQPPPQHWPKEKIIAYRKEAQLILEKLGSFHQYLSERLAKKIEEYLVYC